MKREVSALNVHTDAAAREKSLRRINSEVSEEGGGSGLGLGGAGGRSMRLKGLPMCTSISADLVAQVRKQMRHMAGHFLVATLAPLDKGLGGGRGTGAPVRATALVRGGQHASGTAPVQPSAVAAVQLAPLRAVLDHVPALGGAPPGPQAGGGLHGGGWHVLRAWLPARPTGRRERHDRMRRVRRMVPSRVPHAPAGECGRPLRLSDLRRGQGRVVTSRARTLRPPTRFGSGRRSEHFETADPFGQVLRGD